MKFTSVLKFLLIIMLAVMLGACDPPADDVTISICQNTPQDSQLVNDILTTNIAYPSARYGLMTLPRRRLLNDATGSDAITIDYMVHEPAAVGPSAIVVLIGGGNLDTRILPGPGNTVSSTGLNFLVRSAPMFVSTSDIPLRVITIDRPSDFRDDVGDLDSGFLYDGYRTSMRHTVDLSAVINEENSENLPVFIAGTSRGATSTVANYMLAAGVSISSPASSGDNGRPVREDSNFPEVRPSRVSVPAHLMWHTQEACPIVAISDTLSILNNLPDASGDGVSGGFIGPNNPRPCGAFHYHGYLGIETCAVSKITSWMGNLFPAIPDTRPISAAIAGISTNPDTPVDIDLLDGVTTLTPALMTFAIPHLSTSLGGIIELNGSIVTYTPPLALTGKIDTFVYVVNEVGGGSSHQVVSVLIN
jgi:hypothetical protein